MLLCNGGKAFSWVNIFARGLYAVSSVNASGLGAGGVAATGMRFEVSGVGTGGEGNDCGISSGLLLEGNNREILFETPELVLCASGGRVWDGKGPSVVGEPIRKAEGTECSGWRLPVAGEPIWRIVGTSSMVVLGGLSSVSNTSYGGS